MATSPLLAAMMGGNGSAMVMDPATMQAMPDLQLGQSMQQQGLSTAPASPWEAVARMAQAGVGSYLQHSATSDLAKAYAGSADALQQIFPQGTKLGDALRSSNPMVRMLAMQQAPKAMLLGSEPYSLGPDQERREGGNVIATSNQPQSPQGKVIRDAAAMEGAGVPEAGKALTRTIAKEGMIGDTGVSAPPIPLSRPPIPTAGITPPQQQPSPPQMDAARAALAQRMTAGNNAGLTGAHEAGATSLSDELAAARAKITGAEEAAKANVKFGNTLPPQVAPQPGPGGTEPLKTQFGTTIPPVSEQTIPRSPAQMDEAAKEWQKTQSAWASAQQPAVQAEQRLRTIADVFKSMQTGSFSTQKADWSAKLRSVGMDRIADVIDKEPAKAQLALHENYVETLQQLKAATPRFTQMEFRALSENKEHPNLQPEANLQMLSEDIGQLKQIRDLPRDFAIAQKNGWQNPQAFETSWFNHNPLKNYVEQTKAEIGPLKGMPGNTGNSQQPNSGFTIKRIQ